MLFKSLALVMICRASFCHWAGSIATLPILRLRFRLTLGDGSWFSLHSLRWRPDNSGLLGGVSSGGAERPPAHPTLAPM